MKKVIIVDDEAPARDLIREYLSDYPDLIIVGECNNGVDALRLIQEFTPDLIFLDVQMPGMTGFEVLRKLKEVPEIIFSTAYDKYALDAFEVSAIDYLLKPYTRERFAKAIQKLTDTQTPYMEQIQRLAESLAPSPQESFSGKIFVQTGNKLIAVNSEEIIWLQAEKDYTWLITAAKRYLSSHGLGQLEQKLDTHTFVRVHRSSIVNLNFIQEIDKYPSSYDISMTNGDTVRVSRSYMEEIRRRVL
ncbi:MAG: LytTR family DNA-binding domain-containing protein [Bacteroidota bacterium]